MNYKQQHFFLLNTVYLACKQYVEYLEKVVSLNVKLE